MTEQDIIDAINEDAASDPERLDRTQELVYADWLDEQGDPRGQAWRMLIQEGRFPLGSCGYFWWAWPVEEYTDSKQSLSGCLELDQGELKHPIASELRNGLDRDLGYQTYFSAMNSASIAWVRHHVDAEFSVDIGG